MDYSKMKKDKLVALCKEHNLKGIRKSKKELIEMITQRDATPFSKVEPTKVEPTKVEPTKVEPTKVEPTKVEPTKVEPTMPFITREEAEKSASEWVGPNPSLMRDWLVSAIMDPKQHRDIGKVLAYVAEIYVNKWISEKSGRPVNTITGESWDGITGDDKKKVRNQNKFRMDKWHFETTRRNSSKNAETNATGHVAYRSNEFDMVAIFKPGPTFGITGSTIRCIPVSALIHPEKPDQLITNIPMAIRKMYDNEEKTIEVIKSLYQTPL